jgi:hypothetical protein
MNNKYLSVPSTFLPGVSGGLSTHSAPLASFDKANVNSQRVATKLIANFFSVAKGVPLATDVQALASKPVFSVSGDKVVINVFYYLADKKALNNGSINSLGQVLSKLFKQPVELRFVRLHYPYLDSYILAQYIAINTAKYNFTRIQRAIFGALQFPVLKASELEDTTLPSYITGMKIRISGRLTTQRSVPRQTVQTAQVGSFSSSHIPSNSKASGIISSASFSTKNQKGAFTVKVWISQVAHTS